MNTSQQSAGQSDYYFQAGVMNWKKRRSTQPPNAVRLNRERLVSVLKSSTPSVASTTPFRVLPARLLRASIAPRKNEGQCIIHLHETLDGGIVRFQHTGCPKSTVVDNK